MSIISRFGVPVALTALLAVAPASAQSCWMTINPGSPACGTVPVVVTRTAPSFSNDPCAYTCSVAGVDVYVAGTTSAPTLWLSAHVEQAGACACDFSGGQRFPGYVIGSPDFSWTAGNPPLNAVLNRAGTSVQIASYYPGGALACLATYTIIEGTCLGTTVSRSVPVDGGAIAGIVVGIVVGFALLVIVPLLIAWFICGVAICGRRRVSPQPAAVLVATSGMYSPGQGQMVAMGGQPVVMSATTGTTPVVVQQGAYAQPVTYANQPGAFMMPTGTYAMPQGAYVMQAGTPMGQQAAYVMPQGAYMMPQGGAPVGGAQPSYINTATPVSPGPVQHGVAYSQVAAAQPGKSL